MRTVLVTLLLLLSTGVAAQPAADAPLRVLLRVAPPFVIDEGDGEFSGISVDLWRGMAEDRQVPYEFEVVGLDAMLDVVAAGDADVGVGATTVTAARAAARLHAPLPQLRPGHRGTVRRFGLDDRPHPRRLVGLPARA